MTRLDGDLSFFQDLVETAPDGILVVDEKGRIVLANGQVETTFGYPRQELLGQGVELLVPDAARERHARFREGYAARPVLRPMGGGLSLSRRRKDGTEIPVEISLSPRRSGDGQLLFTAVIRDVTEKRATEDARDRAENTLRQREARGARLSEATARLIHPDALPRFLDTLVQAVRDVSGSAKSLLHLHDDASRSLRLVAHRGFHKPFRDHFAVLRADDVVAAGDPPRRYGPVVVEDVSRSPIFEGTPAAPLLAAEGVRAVLFTPIVTRGGGLLGVFSAHWTEPHRPDEVTIRMLDSLARFAAGVLEHRRVEEELAVSNRKLRESKEVLQATFSIAAVGVAQVDPATRHFLAVNPKMEEITGYTQEELRGKTFADITHPEDRERNVQGFLELLDGRRDSYSTEKRYIRKDGRTIWAQIDAAAIRDDAGRMIGSMAIVQDITLRRESERALRQSEQQLRLITDSAPVLIAHCDTQSRYKFVNEPYAVRFGLKREDLVGKHPSEILGEKAFAVIAPYNALALAGNTVECEVEIPYRVGGTRFMHVAYVPERDSHGAVVGLVAAIVDITERRRTEDALRRVTSELQRTLDTAATGLTRCSKDLKYLSANPSYARIIGSPIEQIVGRRIVDVMGEKGFETFRPYVERVLRGERVEFETEVPLATGACRYLHVVLSPDDDAQGNVVGWVASVTDTTDRNRAEQALRDADRRKDEFLAMLGHELRNPLASIALSVGLIKRYGPGRFETERARSVIERQVQQLARLVDDLLEVSRITSGKIALKRELTDAASVVSRAVETSRPLIESKKHHLSVLVPKEPLELEADPIRLAQALTNLLNNAAKYTEPGGRISVTVEREGNEAVFRVRDTGIGLAADMLETVFEPFVQAHRSLDRSEGGLGLGLPLVRALVQMHGGTVKAFSGGPGQGSELVVRVPATAAEPPARLASHVTREPPPPAHRHCILVVDDNRDIVDALAEALTMSGHEIRAAYDGPGALREVAAGFRPEIVLLDIGLPGMDGYSVARALRNTPGLEETLLVALTGYGQDEDRHRAELAGFDHHLVKPVDWETLAAVLEMPRRLSAPDR
jgi:PAS domain S-box-containing protein